MTRCHATSLHALPAAIGLLVLLPSQPGLGVQSASRLDDPAAKPEVVNINTATAAQLQLLPRIGPAMAGRIIARREKWPFRRAIELRRVRGIGRKTYRLLQPHVVVSGPTTLRTKIRAKK